MTALNLNTHSSACGPLKRIFSMRVRPEEPIGTDAAKADVPGSNVPWKGQRPAGSIPPIPRTPAQIVRRNRSG